MYHFPFEERHMLTVFTKDTVWKLKSCLSASDELDNSGFVFLFLHKGPSEVSPEAKRVWDIAENWKFCCMNLGEMWLETWISVSPRRCLQMKSSALDVQSSTLSIPWPIFITPLNTRHSIKCTQISILS